MTDCIEVLDMEQVRQLLAKAKHPEVMARKLVQQGCLTEQAALYIRYNYPGAMKT